MNRSWMGLLLFIIGLILSVLLNLISSEFQEWYTSNRNIAWSIIIGLIVVAGCFTFLQNDTTLSSQNQTTESHNIDINENLENLYARLKNANQTLQFCKIDAARHTSFDVPYELQAKIQEKENEVVFLKNEILKLESPLLKEKPKNLWLFIVLFLFLSFTLSNLLINSYNGTSNDNLSSEQAPTSANCSYPTRLTKGERAFVENVTGKPNRIRPLPSTRQLNIDEKIQSNEYVTLLDGPYCAENWWWWRIRTENGIEGWTSEGDLASYWLIPENYLPETATVLFYKSLNTDIKDKDFAHSFSFMSNRYRKIEGPLSNWASKFSSTVRVDVTNVTLLHRESVTANVRVDYVTIDRNGWQEVQQSYRVVWTLVIENREWKLDKGIID